MYLDWDSPIHFHPATPVPSSKGIPVPNYGNWGGPGNSGPDGPVDLLDAAFMVHDQAYTSTNPDIRSAADAALVENILVLDATGQLEDPEASLYAGFATLAILGQLALNQDLDLLAPQRVGLALFTAVNNLETGFEAAPQEARSLHGAQHVFEAKFGDLLI